jgi:hypothetical protein
MRPKLVALPSPLPIPQKTELNMPNNKIFTPSSSLADEFPSASSTHPLPYQGTDEEDYMGEGQQAHFRQRLLS